MSEDRLPVVPPPSELLYGGERLVETVDLGGSRVAVTSHRVLVLSPEGAGPRFRAVDRPNVTGVRADVDADAAKLRRGARAGVSAVVLAGAGALVDLDGLVAGVDTGVDAGLGGATAFLGRLLGLLALLDDLLVVAGLLAGAVALGLFGAYLRSRDPHLRLVVAGADPVRLPRPRDAEAAADRLRAALTRTGE